MADRTPPEGTSTEQTTTARRRDRTTAPRRSRVTPAGSEPGRNGAPDRESSAPAVAPSRARRAAGLVDLAAMALLLASAVVGFGPAYGGLGYVRPTLGGIMIGLVVAWLGARFGWSLLTVTAATLGSYLAFGGVVALPKDTLGGVVPTLTTLSELSRGAVTAWKALLTVTPPAAGVGVVDIVPFLSTLITAVVAGSIALRARRPAWAVLPAAVLFVGVILLGTADPARPVAQGTLFALVALAWVSWRRAAGLAEARLAAGGSPAGADTTRLRARRLRNAAAMVGVAVVVSAFATPALAPQSYRLVLRDVVEPPVDLREYPSPLASFRRYVKDLEESTLFTVTGLPDGARIRLATLDAFTGTVMDVAGGSPGAAGASGSFGRMGTTIEAQADGGPAGDPAEVTIEVGEYRGVWIPTLGSPTSITFSGERADALAEELYLNPETGTAVTVAAAGPLQEGDVVTVRADLPIEPSEDDLARMRFAEIALPASERAPRSAADVAQQYAVSSDGPTDAGRATALAAGLAKDGVFSDGLEDQSPSRAGHGAERIDTLLTGRRMVGNDEQFAVAMALMAQSLGMPARAVMGFYPDPEVAEPDAEGRLAITGTDVHAWVEIAYQDGDAVRWVTYDPTPPEDQQQQEQDPRSESEPEPQVLQEPPPPEEPAEPPIAPIPDAADDEATDDEGIPWAQILGTIAMVTLPLLVLLSPFVLIVAAKARRRARRRAAEATVDRLSGGWREVLDAAVDLGTPVTASATRRETARDLAAHYPTSAPLAVADRADAAVFGPGAPTEAEAEAFWHEVETLLAEMAATHGRWRRLRGRVSLRSFGRERTTRRQRGDVGATRRRTGTDSEPSA